MIPTVYILAQAVPTDSYAHTLFVGAHSDRSWKRSHIIKGQKMLLQYITVLQYFAIPENRQSALQAEATSKVPIPPSLSLQHPATLAPPTSRYLQLISREPLPATCVTRDVNHLMGVKIAGRVSLGTGMGRPIKIASWWVPCQSSSNKASLQNIPHLFTALFENAPIEIQFASWLESFSTLLRSGTECWIGMAVMVRQKRSG